MNVSVVVCLSLALSVAVFAEDNYFENLEVEKTMNDDAKMKAIHDCLLERAPCGDYQKLKDKTVDALVTDCGKCTPKAKEQFELAKKLTMEKYPKEAELVLKKYVLKSK